MKRFRNALGGVLGLVGLGVLAVVLTLVFSSLRDKQMPAVSRSPLQTPTPSERSTAAVSPTVTRAGREKPSPTATHVDETFKSPLPTPTATSTPTPSPTPTMPAPALEDYVFGEPAVVLTHTAGIGIARWLPDGERLLIVRTVPGKPREYVETLEVRTGELRRYGERHSMPVKPVWLDRLGKVAFADTADHRRDLWVSGYDQEKATEATLVDIDYPMAGAGDVVWVVPSNERSLVAAGEEGRRQDISAIDLAVYGFEPDDVLTHFRMVIAPDGERLAAYDQERFVILDLKTGSGWPIDLGTKATEGSRPVWAYYAEWSPDGHYLALVTSVGELPFDFTDLTILDTHTGKLRSMHPEQYVDQGQYYVTGMAWSPNSRHLAVGAVTRVDEVGIEHQGLYLADVVDGQFRRILPDHEFGGPWESGLAWSADGSRLAVLCPRMLQTDPPSGEGGLCVILVDQPSTTRSKQ